QAPWAEALGGACRAFGATVGAVHRVGHRGFSFAGTFIGPHQGPVDEADSSLRVGSPSAFGVITLVMSHSRIVASEEPEASARPSGVNASDRTEFRWPFSA